MTKHLSILLARESDPGNSGPFLLSFRSIIQLITSNNNELELDYESNGLFRHQCDSCANVYFAPPR